MKHELKSFHAEVKAYDAATGTVEALVSVFNNVDYGNDRVMPGAFAQTLQEWDAKGDPIPVIWSHEWDDPTSHIGVVTSAAETTDGLLTTFQLDVEANPKAAYVARLLKQRRVTQFSFGYSVREYQYVTDPDGKQVRELTNVDVFEVGPTLLGMNPATQLIQAASLTANTTAGEGTEAPEADSKNDEQTDPITDPAVSRDTPDNIITINPEIYDLLTRPRHTEENR